MKAVWRGKGTDLFLVLIWNLFLTVITAGIYLPWARAAQRRYLWKQIELGRERLEYTGTGRGLLPGLLGWLVVVGAAALVARFVPASRAHPRAALIAATAALVVLAPAAFYTWLRHLVRHTRWRGAGFDLAGSAASFGVTSIAGALLALVTLGLYAPVLANRLYGTIVRNARYAGEPFTYDGQNGDAFRITIRGVLLSVMTLGVYRFWYRAALWRFRAAHTRRSDQAARFDVSGGLLLKLAAINFFANLLSLGLTLPWTTSYTLSKLLARLG